MSTPEGSLDTSFAIATNVQGCWQAVLLAGAGRHHPSSTGGAKGKAVLPPSLQGVPTGWRSLCCPTGERSCSGSACRAAPHLPSSLYRLSGNDTSSSSTVQSLKGGMSAMSQPESKTLLKGRDEMND